MALVVRVVISKVTVILERKTEPIGKTDINRIYRKKKISFL